MEVGKIYADFGTGTSQSVNEERAHCFACEIDMPVKYNKGGYPYCGNCGLKQVFVVNQKQLGQWTVPEDIIY